MYVFLMAQCFILSDSKKIYSSLASLFEDPAVSVDALLVKQVSTLRTEAFIPSLYQ